MLCSLLRLSCRKMTFNADSNRKRKKENPIQIGKIKELNKSNSYRKRMKRGHKKVIEQQELLKTGLGGKRLLLIHLWCPQRPSKAMG